MSQILIFQSSKTVSAQLLVWEISHTRAVITPSTPKGVGGFKYVYKGKTI